MEHRTNIKQLAEQLTTIINAKTTNIIELKNISMQLDNLSHNYICQTCNGFSNAILTDAKCEKCQIQLPENTLVNNSLTCMSCIKRYIHEINTSIQSNETHNLKLIITKLYNVAQQPFCTYCNKIVNVLCEGDKCETCFWDFSTTPKCTVCKKLFSLPEQDGKCSGCFGLVLTEWRPTFGMVNVIENGIISKTKQTAECGICYETKQLIHKYACSCNHFACADCSINLKKCPTCRASVFCEIDADDIRQYISYTFLRRNIFSELGTHQWMRATVLKHRNKMDGQIFLYSFYATSANIALGIKKWIDNGVTREMSCDGIHYMSRFVLLNSVIGSELKKLDINDTTHGCADYGMEITTKRGYKNLLEHRKQLFGTAISVEL